MANLEELASILFGKADEGADANTTFIYGTAVTDSADGYVTVSIGEQLFAADDEDESEYALLSLTEDEDSIDFIDEDEEEETDEEVISWDGDDDEAEEDDTGTTSESDS